MTGVVPPSDTLSPLSSLLRLDHVHGSRVEPSETARMNSMDRHIQQTNDRLQCIKQVSVAGWGAGGGQGVSLCCSRVAPKCQSNTRLTHTHKNASAASPQPGGVTLGQYPAFSGLCFHALDCGEHSVRCPILLYPFCCLPSQASAPAT